MRYRALSPSGDMTFGFGRLNFHVDTPAAVGQAVLTRLRLLTGEWFLDAREGTPYATQVLGYGTRPTYDRVMRQRILQTQGVTEIVSYSSAVVDRGLSIAAVINTIYGETTIQASL